jgi:D-3-phosphoglycerate dehydrogenase
MTQILKPKILVTEALAYFEEEKKILEKFAIVKLAENPSEEAILKETEDATIIMVVFAKINKKIIDSAKNLKGIVRYGIGVDNIDLRRAKEKEILVVNVPDYCIGTVADHAFALLLALNRRIVIADKIVKTKNWGYWTKPSLKIKGLDCEGKKIGLIGLGRIGRAVAQRAKGFDMKVMTYDPYITKETANELGIDLVDLDSLLKKSDFISIHAPLTPDTKGIIGERELKLMKKTSYLVNTSRGPLIDENALYIALKKGWIAGAGLDVYEKEPPDPKNNLLKLENIILTPHISYYTEEAVRRLEMNAVDETIRILKGETPKNLLKL